MNKNILITGGSGFIGKNIIKELKRDGDKIINLFNKEKVEGVKNVQVDLTDTDFSFLDNLEFDYVIHLASFSSPKRCKNKEDAFKLNVDATKRFLEKLSSKRIKKIILFSSYLVYKESEKPLKETSPLNIDSIDIYTQTKILYEEVGKNSKLPVVIFRLSNGYGPEQQWGEDATLIPQLIKEAINKRLISLYNSSPVRDYIYVRDIINAVILALDNSFSGILNIGTGIGTSSGEIARLISGFTDAKIKDNDITYSGPKKIVLDITKAKKTLNWKPEIGIKKGLLKTVKYYENLFKK